MTQLGRRLAVAGIVMMGATMLLFGREVERALQARCVVLAPLEVGKEATPDAIAVEPRRGCQVAVELRLRSASVAAAGNAYAPRYNFPFTCTTLDEVGGQPFTQQAALRWDDATRIVRDESADASGGRVHVQHNLPEFREPLSGKLRVRATLGPDTEFGATVESADLKVYDNVDRPADEMVVAGVALLVGPAVMVIGVTLAIVGWARARRQPDDEPMADLPPGD